MSTKSLRYAFLFLFIMTLCTAFANSPVQISQVKNPVRQSIEPQPAEFAPDRVLVQFTSEAVSDPAFEIRYNSRGELTTGLSSFDTKINRMGVSNISAAYIPVADTAQDAELGISRWYKVSVPAGSDILMLTDELKADRAVDAVSPDWQAKPFAPNDPLFNSQWGHDNTGQLLDYCWNCGGHPSGSPVGTAGFDGNVESAWNILGDYGSSGIVIAIIDSGVDIDHPDLNLIAGYDYGDNDSNPDDNSADPGHGTACAGVAAAIANNNLGAAGVAGGCSVMPLKVANNAGSMYFSSIQNALYHAADNGADIVSMSLGAAIDSDSATDAALQYAFNAGVTILAATGNENMSTISYPAVNQYVIAVGAANPCDGRKRSSSSSSETNPGVSTDPNGYTCDGERWWGSNYGTTIQDARSAVDILAPTILPTTDIGGSGGYDSGDYSMWFNGTSCATPFAAGVAALVKSQNPSWSPTQIRQQIVNTALDVQNVESGFGWDRYSGYGMIDAGAALGGGSGNVSPFANANGPYTGEEGIAISFSSVGSADNDGSIVSYAWDFGDGNSSTQSNPSHTYPSAGIYSVSLTVTDNEGATGTDNTTATITGVCNGHSLTLTLILDNYPSETTWDLKDSGSNVIGSGGPYSSSGATISESFCLADGDYTFSIFDSYGDGICCAYGSGSYELSEGATILASGGAFGSSDVTPFTLGVSNQPPVANAGGPYTGTEGLSISFDGGGSNDPDGSITNYSWTFGDGGTGSGVNPSHTYAAAGTYTVTLTVTDNDGATDADQSSVTITAVPNTPPTANAGGPYSGTEGAAVNFDGSGSYDMDGSITNYSWTFGDGGTGSGVNPSHTYAAAGTYTVTLTVTDNDGATDADQTSADITEAAGGWTVLTYDDFESGWGNYTDGGGDCSMYTGGTYAHQGSAAADIQDNSGVASSFFHTNGMDVNGPGYSEIMVEFWYYAVSMDNSREDFWVQYYDGSAWNTVATYARSIDFNNGQFYSETVTIAESAYNFPSDMKIRFLCDASGNVDDVYIDEVRVSAYSDGPPPPNTAPVADAGGPYSGTAGVSLTLDGSGSTDADFDALSYGWDFGDGNYGSGVSPVHTYATDGTYSITLTVDDGRGGTDVDATTAVIDVNTGGGWDILTYDDFESGWGNYSDGGSDCSRYTSGTYAYQGIAALNIQDNSGVASSFTHTYGINVDAPGYTDILVDFYFYPRSMEGSEDFWVQYFDGSSWLTVATFVNNVDFTNGSFYHVELSIAESAVPFPSNMQLRFRCDASGNGDDVYIDQITVSAAADPAPAMITENSITELEPLAKSVSGETGDMPDQFALHPAYPNPFNPLTTIQYDLPAISDVRVTVYNLAGRQIKELVYGRQDAGSYSIQWNADGAPSGMYFVRMEAVDLNGSLQHSAVEKVVLLK